MMDAGAVYEMLIVGLISWSFVAWGAFFLSVLVGLIAIQVTT